MSAWFLDSELSTCLKLIFYCHLVLVFCTLIVDSFIGVGRYFILWGPSTFSITCSTKVWCKNNSYYVMWSTTSMQSMLKLRGLGACPPGKFLKIACSQIDFGGNLWKKQLSFLLNWNNWCLHSPTVL